MRARCTVQALSLRRVVRTWMFSPGMGGSSETTVPAFLLLIIQKQPPGAALGRAEPRCRARTMGRRAGRRIQERPPRYVPSLRKPAEGSAALELTCEFHAVSPSRNPWKYARAQGAWSSRSALPVGDRPCRKGGWPGWRKCAVQKGGNRAGAARNEWMRSQRRSRHRAENSCQPMSARAAISISRTSATSRSFMNSKRSSNAQITAT